MNSQLGGQNSNLSLQEQQTIRMMQAAMESCVVKTAMSGAAGMIKSRSKSSMPNFISTGFAMGGAFGLFMSSFEYAGPVMNEDLVKQTTKQQIKHAFKDMGTRSLSMAKNFGLVGMIYSGTECCIESVSLNNNFFMVKSSLICISKV